MQRLRRIRQLQTAWYVYPSADHTRFIHSLSVMELAGRFARSILKESPLEDLDSYFRFDEYSLHGALSQASDGADPTAQEHSARWMNAMAKRVTWKQVYEYVKPERELAPAFRPEPAHIHSLIVNSPDMAELRRTVPDIPNRILVDAPVANMPKEVLDQPILRYDRRSGLVTQVKPQELETGGVFPHLVLCRVYVDREYARYEATIAKAARQILQGATADSTSF